jgi:hypothetical protein
MNEPKTEAEREREFEKRAKQAFDRSVLEVDASTRARLAQARNRALEERGASHGWLSAITARPLVPAGALAAAVLAAVVVWQGQQRGDIGAQPLASTDLELLLGDEDLEMLDEDMEFYAWLEEQPDFAPPVAVDDGVG